MNKLSPEELKQRRIGLIYGGISGAVVAATICMLIFGKREKKLEAKIFKLEGWQ